MEKIEKEVIQEWKRFLGSDEFRHSTECASLLLAQHFADWQKEQMMADAIDVEVKVDAGGYPYIDKTIELYDYDKDVPLANGGDKVKVIVIKEEKQ